MIFYLDNEEWERVGLIEVGRVKTSDNTACKDVVVGCVNKIEQQRLEDGHWYQRAKYKQATHDIN